MGITSNQIHDGVVSPLAAGVADDLAPTMIIWAFAVVCMVIAARVILAPIFPRRETEAESDPVTDTGSSQPDPPASDSATSASSEPPSEKVKVSTLIGRITFPSRADALGCLAELCHVCFGKCAQPNGYERRWASQDAGLWFDAVYYRVAPDGRKTVVVVRNELAVFPQQRCVISDERIETQCHRMISDGRPEWARTARLVLDSLYEYETGSFFLERWLLYHDIVTGQTVRTALNAHGYPVLGRDGFLENATEAMARLVGRLASGSCRLARQTTATSTLMCLQGADYAVAYPAAGRALFAGLQYGEYRNDEAFSLLSSRGSESLPPASNACATGLLRSGISAVFSPGIWPGDRFYLREVDRKRLEGILLGDGEAFKWRLYPRLARVIQARRYAHEHPSNEEAVERLSEEFKAERLRLEGVRANFWRFFFGDRVYVDVETTADQGRKLVINRPVLCVWKNGIREVQRQTQSFGVLESVGGVDGTFCVRVSHDGTLLVDGMVLGDDVGRRGQEPTPINDQVFAEIYAIAVEAGMSLAQIAAELQMPLQAVQTRVAALRLSGSVLMKLVPDDEDRPPRYMQPPIHQAGNAWLPRV